MASLVGALVGGSAAQAVTGSVAAMLRGRLLHGPLRLADTAGGLVAGAALGLAVAWLVAVVALAQPALGLRRDVQGSTVLPALLRDVPADEVLHALARFDPLPVLPSIADRALPPPDPSVLRSVAARRDSRSVVRIEGTACGLDIQGSGWVLRPGIVVTNAHVVAGEQDAQVEAPGRRVADRRPRSRSTRATTSRCCGSRACARRRCGSRRGALRAATRS